MSYKLVVLDNVLKGFYSKSQDQSAVNGNNAVLCHQEVFTGTRIGGRRPYQKRGCTK